MPCGRAGTPGSIVRWSFLLSNVDPKSPDVFTKISQMCHIWRGSPERIGPYEAACTPGERGVRYTPSMGRRLEPILNALFDGGGPWNAEERELGWSEGSIITPYAERDAGS